MRFNNQDLIDIDQQMLGCDECGGITIKQYQFEVLNILKEIDRICKKNDITYFLMFGTLIGAVRHHGFIPWDDDADIVMTRENYRQFKEACKNDLTKEYDLVSYHDDANIGFILPRVRKVNSTYINRFEISKHGKNAGFYVDIIIMDYLSDNSIYAKLQERCLQALHRIVSPGFSQGKDYLPVCWNLGLKIIYLFGGRKNTIKLLEKILGNIKPEKATRLIGQNLLPDRLSFNVFDKCHFEESWYIPFEDVKLPIPKNAITLLNRSYCQKYFMQGTLLEAGYENEYQAILKRNYYMWNDIMYIPSFRQRNSHIEIVFDSRNNSSIYDKYYFNKFNKKKNDKSAIKERKYREKSIKYKQMLDVNEELARKACEEIRIREILKYFQEEKNNLSVKKCISYSRALDQLQINKHLELSGNDLQVLAHVFIRASYLSSAKRLLNMMRYNNHMGEETAFCQLEEILNIHIQAYYAIFENDYTKMEEYLEQFTEMDCYLVVLLRAVLSYKNKDYQKAEELLQRIQMEEEECFLAHYFLGKIAQENGKKEKAIIYYRQSLDSTCYMPLLEMSLNELKKLL